MNPTDGSPAFALAADDRIYENEGNIPLLDLVDPSAERILDVGCGAGDNAAELRRRNPNVQVFGITNSRAEAAVASSRMEQCWVADLEAGLPGQARDRTYDAIVFS